MSVQKEERFERAAMWIIVWAIVMVTLILNVPMVKAEEVLSTQCTRGTLFYPGSCYSTRFDAYAGPRIIDVRHPIDEARDRAWLDFCKLTFRRDKYGVEHYVYAHKECEYGATN